jgi:hypothetical protein
MSDVAHNVEILSKIQKLLNEVLVSYEDGLPLYNRDAETHQDALLLVHVLCEELKTRMQKNK